MPYTIDDIESLIAMLTKHLRRKLLANTYKEHWLQLNDKVLCERMNEEAEELDWELLLQEGDPSAVWDEAADVAFFAAARAALYQKTKGG